MAPGPVPATPPGHRDVPPGPVDADGVAELLRGASGVLVLGHIRPDADAMGSAVALATAVRRSGVPAVVSFGGPDPVPETLRTLDPDGLVVEPDEVPQRPDVLVCCDVSSPPRLGSLTPLLDAARVSLVVDHHASYTGFGTHHLVEPQTPATVMLVRRIVAALGVEVDLTLARALFAGLYTDTGGFRFGGADALRLGAELVDAGVEPRELMRELSGASSFAWLAALATILAGARREPDAVGGAGLVWASVDAATVDRFRSEVASVSGHLMATAGDGVAALISEISPGEWSTSLRGTGVPDLSAVATRLGGGGHPGAAGVERPGPVSDVLDALRTELAAQVDIENARAAG
ncbi:phosphoesterase RecJ-like protein [Pseudonocardia sediminis]|uniref:Phosphoesterase RecJ-like protein n=1 Tax=Pseudonocardia sediminis TaxID=1397368 RepID=A0A4Q7USX7_PSEST|nr:DHH family phosphoesterase [Pseudonocardia sediminis]RZT84776.1 phosphoesterase RecJ-like protein [Pseudonocardia sediminis]